MASCEGLSGTWAYTTAKAGVLNLTEALAKELAPRGSRGNAIAPASSSATRAAPSSSTRGSASGDGAVEGRR